MACSSSHASILTSKPTPVVHVIDSVPGLYKPPSVTPQLGVPQVSSTLANAYPLRGSSIANGIRQTPPAATGHVFTSSAGQPRMYSEGKGIYIYI